MSKYLKLFETHTEYQTYINGTDKILPNVSYCEDNNEVHYNPWTDPKLVCKYNITDISSPTTLRTEYEQNMFKSMEIDGVLLDNMVTEYQFSTTGEHTVKYELYDETKVGNNAPLFYNITTLTSVSIPNSVTTIGSTAFGSCTGLTRVTIGNSVTTISIQSFGGCSGLTSITSLATTAPTIQSNTFENVKTGGTLYVPTGSTGYDVWMGTGNYYLGKYNWTKVEQ